MKTKKSKVVKAKKKKTPQEEPMRLRATGHLMQAIGLQVRRNEDLFADMLMRRDW